MGRLRIIAGELRGRRLMFPDLQGLRPTPERVREALFSMLAERVVGASVLDAWAGSGALGFEALSRGAVRATFVESDRRAATAILSAAQDLGVADRTRVLVGAAVPTLRTGQVVGPLDLVLADPPWSSPERPDFLAFLASSGLLGAAAVVGVERAARDPAPPSPAGWPAPKSRRWGDAAIDLWFVS